MRRPPCHRALEAALADWPCVKLNPERARRFAQATGVLAKTDRVDAMLLARMAATLQPPIRPARSAQQAQLAELINARDGLVRDRTALITDTLNGARSPCAGTCPQPVAAAHCSQQRPFRHHPGQIPIE